MEATYFRLAPRIEQESKAAKQKAAKLAADAERRSIPVAFEAKAGDPQVHGNILAEAQEIRERVARIKEQTPKGMKAPGRVLDMLREEYAEATETGGLAGYTTCQAVLRAAKVLGISAEEVYGSLRTDAHMQALEEAQRYRMAEQAIPTTVPSLDRGKVGGGHHWKKGGSSRLAIPKGGSIAGGGGKKRKASWK